MPPYADASLSAFGETAVAADDTASLMLHGAAAFGADMYLRRRGRHMAAAGSGRGRAAGRRAALPGRGLRLRMLDSVVVFTDETVHFGQNLSDGVRAGGAAHALLADGGRAADALELVDTLPPRSMPLRSATLTPGGPLLRSGWGSRRPCRCW